MTKVDENIKSAQNLLSGIVERCHELEEENKKLREIITDLSKSNYKSVNQRNDLERENKKLKEEKQELEYLGDINQELKEENQKLKERIKELEATNKKRTVDNWATFKS